MPSSTKQASHSNVLWRQFLIGQTFGVFCAVALFAVELLWLGRNTQDQLGASLITILAVYTAVGWVSGSAAGLLWGIAGTLLPRIRRKDGTVPALGPVIGVAYFALYITRREMGSSPKAVPGAVLTSLAAAVLVWIGLGYLGRRFLFRYVPQERRQIFLNLFAMVALFTLVGSAALRAMEAERLPVRTPASAVSPNVILIVADAVRPDHLSAYGYSRETSPNLERFADNATLFRNAYSHGTRTIPAMASLFTSLYPAFHQADIKGTRVAALPRSIPTVAEICRDAGYTTVGLMSNPFLRSPFGLERGFDRVETYVSSRSRLSLYKVLAAAGLVHIPEYDRPFPSARDVSNLGIEWVRKMKNRPFFLYMQYMDAHHPLLPEPDQQWVFGGGEGVDPVLLFNKTAALAASAPPVRITAGELNALRDLYDGCIYRVDREIGRFLWELEIIEPERETIVIFTSAYGTEFMEHGRVYHNDYVVESLIHVPLIIGRLPADGGGNSVNGLVRHVDLLPTITTLVEGRLPEFKNGADLTPLLDGAFSPTAEFTIAESEGFISLNKGLWKLVFVDSTESYDLYNLSDDPSGLTDVSVNFPRKLTEMGSILDGYMAKKAELPPVETRPVSGEARVLIEMLDHL
jgi:arylsulfatase A-like enzyme